MSRHIEKFIEQFTEEFELPLTVKKVTNGKITIYKLTHKNAKYSMILESSIRKNCWNWRKLPI